MRVVAWVLGSETKKTGRSGRTRGLVEVLVWSTLHPHPQLQLMGLTAVEHARKHATVHSART